MNDQPLSNANRDPVRPFTDIRRAPDREKKKPFVPKGHDAQLNEAQNFSIPVSIVCMDTDEPIKGIVMRRDKFTITVRLDDGPFKGEDGMVYKHAIKMVVLHRDRG